MTKPYQYQKQGAAQIEIFGGRALLADEMGLGKSFQLLLWARRNPEARPVVIVCPAHLKYNWQNEIRMHLGMDAAVLEGTKPPPVSVPQTHGFIIINYDILWPWMEYLKALKPQLVATDEAHYICNRKTQRARAVEELLHGVPYYVAISGTPMTNRPIEIWNIARLVKPGLFDNFREYADRYCRPRLTPWGWKFDGARNLPELHGILKEHMMIRRLKKDVLKDLPAKRRIVVPMDAQPFSEYERARDDFIQWLMQRDTEKARRASRAEKVVRTGYLKRLAGYLKLDAVREWIRLFLEDSNEKLIIFGTHRNVLQVIKKEHDKIAVLVDGSVNAKDRQRATEQFNRDPRTRLFVGNMKAAGTGWNGTAASTVAFVELGWTPGEHTQAEDRVHRIGQTEKTTAYYLVARNTMEESLCKIIQEKQHNLDATLDGKAGVSEMDILDQLELELLKEGQR